jgi:MFS family permease
MASPKPGAAYSRDGEEHREHNDRQSLLHGGDDGDGSKDGEEAEPPQQPKAATIRDLLGVRRYPFVLAAGLLFDFARIAMAFLGPYYMNDATHSPRLVQLTGAASWCFLVAGPCFGLISDRFDRRRTVLTVLIIEAVMAAVVGTLMVSGLMRPFLMVLYMVQSSVCGVLDTTNRPAMIYDLLFSARSEHLVGKAMALRSIGSNCGRIFGNQLVGYVIEAWGVGWTYALVSCCLALSGLLLCAVPSPPKAQPRNKGKIHRADPKFAS